MAFAHIVASLLDDIIEAVELGEVPPDLIFNWDQTGILLVLSAQWTMDKKGRKRVPIAGQNGLIYEGKTKRCHPPFDYPRD